MKSIKIGAALTIFIGLCIFLARLFAPDYTVASLFETADSKEFKGAIFERNGEICRFDYSGRKIAILDGGGMYDPVLCPDKTRILYRRSVFETAGNALQFGIIDMNGKPVLTMTIESEVSNDILDCRWLSDTAVGITTHINPSTSEFFIYDAASGKVTGHYIGYLFAQIPDTEKIIYAENVPHWSDETVYHSFAVDEKTIYTSDILDARLYPPVFSEDVTKSAFMEGLPNSDGENGKEKWRIITADFDKNNMMLTNISSIEVPPEISGTLAFDSNNNLCLVNGNLLQVYDKNTSTFKQKEITADVPDRSEELKYFEELQKAVTKYWGDDSLEKINHINWIF